jgi:hypothetical protein
MWHHRLSPLGPRRVFFLFLLSLFCATAANAAVTLEWDPNDPSPDGYRLFRRLDGEDYNYSDPLGDVTGTRYVDGTIAAGETYFYVVRAYEGENESGDSNEVSYTAPADSGGDDSGGDDTGGDDTGNDGGDTGNDNTGDGTSGGDDATDTPDTVTDQAPATDPIGLTPLLSATMSVDGDRHAATRWQISLDQGFTSLVLDQVSETSLDRYLVPDMVLDAETVYYWRATFLDENRETLTQSTLATFETITAADTDDTDSNGLIDAQEVAGDDLDLDDNGVSDAAQDDLACVAAGTGEGHVGLKVANGNARVVGLKSVSPDQVSNTRNLPQMTEFGAVSFKLYLEAGQSEATVSVYFSEPAPDDTDWFKYNAELGWQLYEGAQFSDDRRSVSYTLIDGGSGDDDGVVNGVIIDPAGLGYRQAADTDDTATDADATPPAVSAGSSSGGSCFIGATVQRGGTTTPAAALAALIAFVGGAFASRRD